MNSKPIKLRVRKDGKPPSFKRAMLISAGMHVAVFTLFIIFPMMGVIEPKEPLDITWVELPKGSGEDIYGLKNVNHLPDSTIQQQQEAQQQMTQQEQAKQPEAKESAAPAKEASDKAMPEPKTDKSKTKKAPAGKKPSGLDKALAKIDQRLKDRRLDPQAAQVESGGEGYKYGTSDKAVRVPIDDPDYLKYQAMIRSRILGQWVVPGTITQMTPESRPVIRIIVLISKNGDVISKRWANKSQAESLNTSAMRAIERASPFPIPPERLKWEAYNEGFLVEFNPRRR